MGDMVDTKDTVDTVAREKLKLNQKPGAPLDTDTVPDMVLVDMEVTVLALPAMGVTAVDMEVMVDTDTVDTVERDLLMPGTDVTTVDTEDTDMVDTETESKFHTSINLLPFILILVIIPAETMHYSIPSTKENQIIFRHVSSKVEEEF